LRLTATNKPFARLRERANPANLSHTPDEISIIAAFKPVHIKEPLIRPDRLIDPKSNASNFYKAPAYRVTT
jgi:hypothetical protein